MDTLDVFRSPDLHNFPIPDYRYLALYAAVAKVVHMVGMAKYLWWYTQEARENSRVIRRVACGISWWPIAYCAKICAKRREIVVSATQEVHDVPLSHAQTPINWRMRRKSCRVDNGIEIYSSWSELLFRFITGMRPGWAKLSVNIASVTMAPSRTSCLRRKKIKMMCRVNK